MIASKLSFFVFFVTCTLHLAAQKAPASVIKEIEEAESKMFRNVNYSHVKEYYATDVADEFFSINADGTTRNKEQGLADTARMKMFEMATYKFFDREVRAYGNVGITNGRVQAFFNEQMVAEFLYTTVFVKRNGKWMYTSWQGTLSQNSPKVPPMQQQ